jgi:hypothetical protein
MSKPSKGFKYLVKAHGDFTLDYSEFMRNAGCSAWFIGRGRVAGNTTPIPSGLHHSPRKAWEAAAKALNLV